MIWSHKWPASPLSAEMPSALGCICYRTGQRPAPWTEQLGPVLQILCRKSNLAQQRSGPPCTLRPHKADPHHGASKHRRLQQDVSGATSHGKADNAAGRSSMRLWG